VGSERAGRNRGYRLFTLVRVAAGRVEFRAVDRGPAEIKAERVKKQKFDRDDARLLRRLMLENKFPQIWILIPSPEDRDRRQLLWHRHRLLHRPPDPARLLGNLSHKLSGINESLRTNCRH
jgi:hypothetical protein